MKKPKYNYYVLKFTGASFINNALVCYAWDRHPQGVNPFEALKENNRDIIYISDPDNGEAVKMKLTAIMATTSEQKAKEFEITLNKIHKYKGVEAF